MRTADPPSSREHSGIWNCSSETLGAAAWNLAVPSPVPRDQRCTLTPHLCPRSPAKDGLAETCAAAALGVEAPPAEPRERGPLWRPF